MKRIDKRYLVALVAILLITMIIGGRSISAKQSDPSGLFDFSDGLQSKEFYTALDGDWNFF